MFPFPASLNDNVQQFLSLAEAQKILTDLNKILHKTAFNPRASNPCFLLALLASFGSLPLFVSSMVLQDFSDYGRNAGLYIFLSIFGFLVGMMLPYTCFFVLVCVTKSSRRKQLINYIADWNSRGNGVMLSFGGGGTTPRGVTVGSEFGGTYNNFYMAMWDPKGLMFRGYLHVFVHTGVRQQWCSSNNTYYVAPIPLGQVAPIQVVSYQPPPGYALVPMAELQAAGNPPSAPPSYEKAVA